MQERRAGSLPALRRPWPLALCQLVKSSLAGSPSHPRSLWGHSQVGGVSVSPPSRSQGSLPCALQGGGWTVSLGSLGDRTSFSPSSVRTHRALSLSPQVSGACSKATEISPTSGLPLGFSSFSPFRAGGKAWRSDSSHP